MPKFAVRIVYKIPFDYEVEAVDIDEAENMGRALASEEYENEGTFDIDEEIESIQEIN